jgi:hypothetical protein
MHNSIPEYVSTASISTIMTLSFHVKPFENKVFEEVIFLLKYHKNPQVLKKQSIEKKKKGKRKNKRKEKKKLQESPQIKGEVNILRGEKHFNFKDPF